MTAVLVISLSSDLIFNTARVFGAPLIYCMSYSSEIVSANSFLKLEIASIKILIKPIISWRFGLD